MLIHIQRPTRTALLLQLDGTLPNLALMRLAAHLRERNCDVHFKRMRSCTTLQDSLFAHWDDVYASAIFEKTRPLVEELKRVFPKAIVGGTGSGSASRLEEIGVSGFEQDYSLYPRYAFSIGFTQRGCRLRCPFCVVPWMEGRSSRHNRFTKSGVAILGRETWCSSITTSLARLAGGTTSAKSSRENSK